MKNDELLGKLISKTKNGEISWNTKDGVEFIKTVEIDNADKTLRIYFAASIDERTTLKVTKIGNYYTQDKERFFGSTPEEYAIIEPCDKTKELYELLQSLNGEKVVKELLAVLNLM